MRSLQTKIENVPENREINNGIIFFWNLFRLAEPPFGMFYAIHTIMMLPTNYQVCYYSRSARCYCQMLQ